MNDLSDINLMDLETLSCPYDAYDRLRDEAPVYQMPQSGAYVVTRYDLVMEAVRNTEVFSSQMGQNDGNSTGGVAAYPEVVELFQKEGYPFASTLISADPPEHTRYRSLVNRAFTAGRVRKMQPYIQAIVDELIDAFIDDGAVEFVEAFEISERLATDNPDLIIDAPFVNSDKSEIVKLGHTLGVPFEQTWTCYKGGQLHCGVCSSCRERKRAFIESGVLDPTGYEQ